MGYYNNKHISAKEFRQLASKQCKSVGGTLNLIYLIYFLIMSGLYAITSYAINLKSIKFQYFNIDITLNLYPIISLFVLGGFVYSFAFIGAKISRLNKPELVDLFKGFEKYWKTFLIYFAIQLYTSLWSLLFIIPGIVKSYSYSMAIYIYMDNPELDYSKCIERSIYMMNGHKKDLFCLHLSYIGWIILSILTCGILFLWVAPKMQQAQYLFYLEVKKGVNI